MSLRTLLDIRNIAVDLNLIAEHSIYENPLRIIHPMNGSSSQERILQDRAFKAMQDILFQNSIFYEIEQDDFWKGDLRIVVGSADKVGPFVQPTCPLSTRKLDVKALRELAMRGNLGTNQDATHFYIQKSWTNIGQMKGFKYIEEVLKKLQIRYSIKYEPEDFVCCYICVPLLELGQ